MPSSYAQAVEGLLADSGWRHSTLSFFPARQLREVPPDQLRPWPFPAFLDNPACPWLQTLKRLYANPVSFPASLSPDAGLLLHALVRNIQPRTVIETGTFLGISTTWMAAALADLSAPRILHTFDAFLPIEPGPWRIVGMQEERRRFVEHHINDAGLSSLVRLHEGWSVPTILEARAELGPVQLAFLDADHTEQGVLKDFHAVAPLIEAGGYVILHDTHPALCGYDGPKRLMETVNQLGVGAYAVVDVYLAPVNYGLAIIQRVG